MIPLTLLFDVFSRAIGRIGTRQESGCSHLAANVKLSEIGMKGLPFAADCSPLKPIRRMGISSPRPGNAWPQWLMASYRPGPVSLAGTGRNPNSPALMAPALSRTRRQAQTNNLGRADAARRCSRARTPRRFRWAGARPATGAPVAGGHYKTQLSASLSAITTTSCANWLLGFRSLARRPWS